MAQQVRFGRLPRAAPSLTATIVAAAQQYENQRERNLVDAWNNGGDWEGKKATDERLLSFYQNKLKDLDPADPAANEVRNLITQYEFSIANSKMELKYAQKKASDGDMARFYDQWAAKLPRDSQAYRERAKLAAQYRDRAASASRGRRKAASSDAYYNRLNSIYENKIKPFDDVYSILADWARSGDIGQSGAILDTPEEDFGDVRVSERDATNLFAMLDDEEWRKSAAKVLQAAGFEVTPDMLTQQGLTSLSEQAMAGYNQQIALARAQGRQGDVTDLLKRKEKLREQKAGVSTLDEKQDYEDLRDDWMAVVNNPNSTVAQRLAATNAYSNGLLDLAIRAKSEGNHTDAGRFNTEYLATQGDPNAKGTTMWESSRDAAADHKAETGSGDAQTTAEDVRNLREGLAMLNQRDEFGRALYTQVMTDGKGNVVNDPAKAMDVSVSLVSALPTGTVFIVAGADGTGTKVSVGGPLSMGSDNVTTAVVPTPITAQAYKQNDAGGHTETSSGEAVPLGQQYRLPGGQVVWSYTDRDGTQKFSLENPFIGSDGAEATYRPGKSGGMEMVVDITPAQSLTVGQTGLPGQNYIREDHYDPDLSGGMPNVVGNSIMAMEMMVDPKATYSKYNRNSLVLLAGTNANGDQAKAERILEETDEQRAAFISSGGLDYDAVMRLSRSRKNGDLPLLADYAGGITATTGFDVRGTLGYKENVELSKRFGGLTGEEMAMTAFKGGERGEAHYRLAEGLDDLHRNRASQTAARLTPKISTSTGFVTSSIADQSRQMSRDLINQVWGSVMPYGGSAAGYIAASGVRPSPPGTRTGPRGTAPRPTVPKATTPGPRPTTSQGDIPRPTEPPKPTKPKAPKPPPKPGDLIVNDYTGFVTGTVKAPPPPKKRPGEREHL